MTPEEIVASLDLDDKVRMMHGTPKLWLGLADLTVNDAYHHKPFAAADRVHPEVGGIHFADGPRGVVIDPGTMFPVPMARGASFDPDLERRIGDAIGKEIRAHGANLFGGVCINLLRHPAWGRAQETYGEDPTLLAEMGMALVDGVQNHAMATVKHFALNSMEDMRFDVDVACAPRPLHEVYLRHFKEVIDAGAAVVMSAYNAVNGEWCGQSRTLLRDILKNRWGFEGFVITDWVFGLRDAVAGIEAGQDLEMPYGNVYRRELANAVRSGAVDESLLDDAILRMIRTQRRVPDGDYPAELLHCEAHTQLAREAGAACMVLLKNDDALLPLDRTARIALVGELAAVANLGDEGSSNGRPPYAVSPLEGLSAVADVTHIEGTPEHCANAASSYDVAVVVVGYTEADEGESLLPPDIMGIGDGLPAPDFFGPFGHSRWGQPLWKRMAGGMSGIARRVITMGSSFGLGGDRRRLTLRPEHEALIRAVAAANPRTLVVIEAGSAVLMEAWRADVPGILMAWYPGMEGGHALADVLFGEVAPGGRLPFSIPTDAAHLPDFDPDARAVTYDFWHGYRKLAHDGNPAAFPFGFGLTTTIFAWSEVSAAIEGDTLEVAVSVENTGPRDAPEVVQVYLAKPDSRYERAPRQLVGFRRVSVASGRTERVEVRAPLSRFDVFDTATDGFVREPGPLEVLVCRHAEDPDPLRVSLEV